MRKIAGTVILIALPFCLAPQPAAGIESFDISGLEELAALTRSAPAGAPAPTSFGPPPNPQVGDSWLWYIWRLNGMPSAIRESCTVRGSSANAYVVVRDIDWNVYVTQADVDSILDHMENRSYGIFPGRGIYSLDTESFGDPPMGLDNDQKIYLLYYDLDISADGFAAAWADPYPDQGSGLNKSNECEVVYLNCGPDMGVDHSPSGNYMLAVAAHEIEHVIHNGIDPNEENWLDECLAEIGMYLFDPTVEHIAGFLSNPDVSITLNNPSGSYGARYFFGTHFYEEYGGPTFTRQIINTGADGIPGFNMALAATGRSETFEDVFQTWLVANWLDDPRIAGGVYGYDDFDYGPMAASRTLSSYPAGPFASSVSQWAADYIQYRSFSPDPLLVTFNGTDTDTYAVQILAIDSTDAMLPQVIPMALDGRNEGAMEVPAGYDTAVMVVGAMAPCQDPSTYTFGGEIVAPFLLWVSKGPDPVSETVLEWDTADRPPFDVLRGGDAATLLSNPPDTFMVIDFTYTDTDSPYPLTFYAVSAQ